MTLLCFMYRMKLSKCYYGRNLNEHARTWWCSAMDLTWLIMVGTTSFAKISNSTKVKLVRLLKKHGMACMVIKTSHTLLLRSNNCPPPSSKFTNVKSNQMLMWVIIVSNVIQSSNSISSSKSSPLLEKLVWRLEKINSINHKWNGCPKIKVN